MKKKIAILYSQTKKSDFATHSQFLTEKDSCKDAQIVSKYCHKLGNTTYLIAANELMIAKIKENKPDMVINMVGSVRGKEELAATIPAILDFLDIPYSGADFIGESMAYDKYQIKQILKAENVPTPACQLFYSEEEKVNNHILCYPVIVKLNTIHGSVEITKDSVCRNEMKLRIRIKYLIKKYNQPVLVENFITGDEFSAVGVENDGIKTFTAKNIFADPKDKNLFASFDLQWSDEEVGFEKFHDPVLSSLMEKAFKAVKMRDYGKFDIRKDKDGIYYFLDANTNPAFGPKENNCAISTVLDLYGISFEELLGSVIKNTLKRGKKSQS